jgi:hypothetical protein
MKPGFQGGTPTGWPTPRRLSAAMEKGVFPAQTPFFALQFHFQNF